MKLIFSFLLLSGFIFNLFSQDLPVSGKDVPEMKAFDDNFTAFMKKWEIPGGQVAVSKDGRLVYSRAFGYSDKEAGTPATTDNLFRIASTSKPFTGVAIMKLVQDGKLKLDDKAFNILNDLTPPPGSTIDLRLYDITVQMLLEHSGGWTIEKGDRQINYLRLAADVFGEPRPASAKAIIRYTMGEPLDFTPGTRTVYSNFGYNILGRIIEKVSGKSYEQYVNEDILYPIGVTNMKIARTREIYRLPNEVKYYGNPNYEPLWSVLDEEQKQVGFPYGADYYIEVMDAHGGWLSTAEDLVKFAASVDIKTKRKHILNDETYKLMVGPPVVTPPAGAKTYHVKGWNYDPVDGGISHAGALWGVCSYLYNYGNGITIAVIFNYLPMEKLNDFLGEMNMDTFPNSMNGVTNWPEGDMFEK